jgi:hypothetical protein
VNIKIIKHELETLEISGDIRRYGEQLKRIGVPHGHFLWTG